MSSPSPVKIVKNDIVSPGAKFNSLCVLINPWLTQETKWLLRAALDKGPEAKSPGTNLNQIEPWIEPFFTLKKHFSVWYNECV
jgi:hypothetical protein